MHSLLIQETGGSDGIRDEELLDSVLNLPFQSFDGEAMRYWKYLWGYHKLELNGIISYK